ncbi:uncharacterized protein LOC130666890 [Microplitis mediator]|uniref:uncharacterized protein LOC130666890 n=1 Tax=Microplitis mediator TaxID=375433 RepID=UPI0025576C47|nr:uncharacterized protein LOC130666890 [Microplitis mediator]
MSSAQFKLPSFTLFRNDRSNRIGGGVALYVHNSISSKHILSSTYLQNHPEYLFMEVWQSARQRILVGVVYNPPTSQSLDVLEADLDDVLPHYSHAILIGDFNINMINVNSKSESLLEFCRGLALNLIEYKATHHTVSCHSWIDHCLVSDLDSVLSSSQSEEPFLADHDLISLKYKYNISYSARNKFWSRNWSGVDKNFLQDTCSRLDLFDVDNANSVDEMNTCIHDHIKKVTELVAPLREMSIREKPAPWINRDIKALQRRRSKLYRIYRRSGYAFKEYTNLRKVIKSRISEAKKRYFDQRFHNCKDAKSMWNDFRKLGLIKCADSYISHDLDLNKLNNYFVTMAGSSIEHIDYEYFDSRLTTYQSAFTFKALDCSDVKKAIMRITSRSKGPDGFDIKMYKFLAPYFIQSITKLFNLSLSTGCFPSAWKQSYVLPLPKVRSPIELRDYRPISLLCTLSKSLERCVHDQIMNYLTSNDIFDEYQTAFRMGLNTQDAILELCDDIRLNMSDSMITIAIFFDFSKAFDSVVFEILIYKLKAMGFANSVIKWVESYLTDRLQAVRVSDISMSE